MSEYKTVQELILKAAMLDGVTTTIRANELFGGYDVLEIIFSKGDRHSSTRIDVHQIKNSKIPEEATLYSCQRALRDLFMAPYEEIVIEEK